MEIKVNFLDKLRLEAKFDDFTVVADPAVVYLHRQPMLLALAHRVVVSVVSLEAMLLLAALHHRPLEGAVLVAERGVAHSPPNALEYLRGQRLQLLPRVEAPLKLRVGLREQVVDFLA